MIQRFLSGIERGVENPTLDNLIRLAKALGVEAYDLFLFGASEDSEKALRKAVEKMLKEADWKQLQLYFEVMKTVMEFDGGRHTPEKQRPFRAWTVIENP